MEFTTLFGADIYAWCILPVLIFLARIMDVSLGTIRIIFVSRDLKYFAPFVGFFEVLIWLLVIRQIMLSDGNNTACIIAYAAGFASGTFVGMYIENLLSFGRVLIRVITRKEAGELVEYLKSSGYGLTCVDATGATGPVKLVFSVVERHDIPRIVEIIKRFNPNAFYTIEDVRFVSENVLPFRIKASRNPLSVLYQRKAAK
ncbi:MAG: DUF2179 domain-containing protein [Desulfomonilia bacterium]|jgi:uncharacterized protein YebE (UPF0316 family)|nr:DUF2179 domain-containing protein [Pseudomonadota bacterium]HON38812.1 DUF2179 domain-containing protein [Deltaproteobacteria bacterium]HRS56764.1 DUF2179 domain-containing protein [Desulfomonilia bacterium]HPD21770.1 DUF2179 domain-containing protein [Deltaproteobacteria bacterium]HPX18674.1 DUF2179 domain-containing protein [Deltaproteobacteria bacterium]